MWNRLLNTADNRKIFSTLDRQITPYQLDNELRLMLTRICNEVGEELK